eukprot:1500954-Pyramimonas_sp.AAC.1
MVFPSWRGFQAPQSAPRGLAPRVPKTVQAGSKSPTDRSKTPKIASRRPQTPPRRPKRPRRT